MPLPPHDIPLPIVFGPFEFDEAAFRLRRDGVTVALEPKALALLQLLIASAPRVVDKSVIFAAIWKDVAVTDNALTRVVTQLRKALDDDPRSPHYIETVATRGYRWIAALEAASVDVIAGAATRAEAASAAVAPAVPHVPRLALLALAVFITLTAAGLWFGGQTRDRGVPTVSPFPDATVLAALQPAQMSASQGYDGFLSFSPDGRSLAFSSDRSGALEIYVQGTAPGSTATMLTSNGKQNVQPEWSPDGQFIAFHEMSGNGIWVMPSRGGVARKISDFGSNPSWSPDGQRIAFQSIPVTQVNALGVPGVPGTIWMADVEGRVPPVALTSSGNPQGPHLNPEWFDDRHVMFVSGQDSDTMFTMWNVTVADRQLHRMAADERLGFDFAIAPNHQRILFIGRGRNTIWQWPLDATGSLSGEPMPTGLPTAGAFLNSLTMAGDGRRIGWTSVEITGHVWAREGDDASGSPRVMPLTRGDGIRFTNPTPSSDGRLIMNGIRAGSPFSLYMMDPSGEPRAVTPHPPGHGGSQWLPGEREVVVFTEHQERQSAPGQALYAVEPATGRERLLFLASQIPRPSDSQLSSAAPPANVSFSSTFDRAVTAFVKGGQPNLWLFGLRNFLPDGTLVQKTFERDGGSYPTWSPDDTWIGYQCGAGTDTHVCVVNVETGERTQITHEPGQSWIGGWGRDSDTLLFAAQRSAVWNIAAVSRTTGEVRMLTRFTNAAGYVRYPRWDAFNKRVLFERSEATGRTWSVTLPDGK